jgi:hypothetical protein
MAVRTDRITPNQTSKGVVFSEKSGIHQESSTALHAVGTRMKLDDGRTFYYARANGTAIAEAGRVITAIKQIASETDTSITEVAGSKEIGVTAVAATGASYEGGYFVTTTGTGKGQTHKIHSCTTTAAAGAATVYLYDELVTALSTGTAIMTLNPFYGVGEATTDGQIAQILGVNPIPVTANYYFWLQTYGWAATMRGDSTGAEAEEQSLISHASGSSFLTTTGGGVGKQEAGYHIYDGVDGVSSEWELSFLKCVA